VHAGKQDMYEGGIRIAAGAAWPGKIQRSSKSDRVALAMDVFEPFQLFRLKDDPIEQTLLPQNRKMYNQLLIALRSHITEAGAIPWQKHPVNLNNPLTH